MFPFAEGNFMKAESEKVSSFHATQVFSVLYQYTFADDVFIMNI